MARPKKHDDPYKTLVNQIVAEGMRQIGADLDIIEFTDQILELDIWPTQRAVLKALYNLPLEKGQWKDLFKHTKEPQLSALYKKYSVDPDDWWDEREILLKWKLEDKTTWVEGADYSELNLECGMRGSKTSMTSIPATYEFWKLLQHDDPAATFGLLPNSLIAILVLATTELQSRDTLFAAIRGRILASPYFQTLINNGELVVNTMDIQCPQKNLLLWAGHSKSESLVGRTLMLFAMDEANRFGIEGGGGATGIELYANVGKGTLTLSSYGSKKFIISSAWCEGDITETLYEMSETEEGKHILSFRLTTPDMNPEFTLLGEDHPEIKKEIATRGIEAKRDYFGIRPGSEEGFFNKYAVDRVSIYPCLVTYRAYEKPVHNSIDGTTRTYSAVEIFCPDDLLKGPVPSFGHCDPGLKKDSFGFVSAHPEVDPATGNVIAVVDACVEWRPVDKGRGNVLLVDFEGSVNEIKKIAKPLHLQRLTFDHWNSAMHIQVLYSAGISTEQFKSSFSQVIQRQIYQVLREWIDTNRVKLPPPSDSPAAAKLNKELKELLLANGRQIKHPKTGSKDLADALACVVFKISQDERRFRYHEMGRNNISTSGQIHVAKAIDDLFQDEKYMRQRAETADGPLRDPRRITPTNGPMTRKTSVTQSDW